MTEAKPPSTLRPFEVLSAHILTERSKRLLPPNAALVSSRRIVDSLVPVDQPGQAELVDSRGRQLTLHFRSCRIVFPNRVIIW